MASFGFSPHVEIHKPVKNDSDTDRFLLQKGRCRKCGIYTHGGFLRITPLSNQNVHEGRCLKCFPMDTAANSLTIPAGNSTNISVEQAQDGKVEPDRRCRGWLYGILLVVLIVIIAAVLGVVFATGGGAGDDNGTTSGDNENSSIIDNNISTESTNANGLPSRTENDTGVTTTSPTFPDTTQPTTSVTNNAETTDNDPLYSIVWDITTDSFITSMDWAASRQATADDCMKVCDSLGKDSGMFYQKVGLWEAYSTQNCFCTSTVECFVEVPSNRVAIQGTGFTRKNKRDAQQVCNYNVCEAWPEVCTHAFSFVWKHADDTAMSFEEYTASQQNSLDDCMQVCMALDNVYGAGHFFSDFPADDDNCYCTSNVLCYSPVLTNEVSHLKYVGYSFTNQDEGTRTSCDASYCELWPSMCN